MQYAAERFTPDEEATLRPYFTNLDGPVFALVNLPQVVKGALFARYSRSAKSLRRLFLDEFADQVGEPAAAPTIGTARANPTVASIVASPSMSSSPTNSSRKRRRRLLCVRL